uniref:uncharacterized protein LOC100182285 isoform X1 n=1 Tax=Ciona intestinalis TaxID=7719 RepID=UPI0002B8D71B|nr:uncharacterized protein LOC100182285 isoform X1 [Ciona intestinalis]|eukprot:XP_002125630.2 uncharacterized protein LOC100182285 isoform X1 [Ciona intestinalis]
MEKNVCLRSIVCCSCGGNVNQTDDHKVTLNEQLPLTEQPKDRRSNGKGKPTDSLLDSQPTPKEHRAPQDANRKEDSRQNSVTNNITVLITHQHTAPATTGSISDEPERTQHSDKQSDGKLNEFEPIVTNPHGDVQEDTERVSQAVQESDTSQEDDEKPVITAPEDDGDVEIPVTVQGHVTANIDGTDDNFGKHDPQQTGNAIGEDDAAFSILPSHCSSRENSPGPTPRGRNVFSSIAHFLRNLFSRGS